MLTEEPPQKIRKLNSSIETPNLVKLEVIPILDPKLKCSEIPTTSFQAIQLENKRVIGQIIGRLKELPEEFQHLKRVGKDGSVLISENKNDSEQIVLDLGNPVVQLKNLKTILVPAIKPLTRRQFDFAKQVWPTGFHPNHEIERILDGSWLTESLKVYIIKWSQYAIDLKNGCISVQNDVLLSSGSPSTHPLGHAVMEMVGNLPKRTGSDYLGTGADVFLVNEPCAMCSMALVHFRIKRLFYVRSSKNGILKDDGWQLHLEPSINHHYEVYKVNLPENEDDIRELSVPTNNSLSSPSWLSWPSPGSSPPPSGRSQRSTWTDSSGYVSVKHQAVFINAIVKKVDVPTLAGIDGVVTVTINEGTVSVKINGHFMRDEVLKVEESAC
ncbi:hypothetical protein B9Z55_009811 [Caenorhabditis nigoni]|uniref:CMP/dCMP-type deaminase domain-containing protein n=1 Tax=Caenorhabditis nigoni TaxID=1611254 RepID=A0A2G5UTK8_9PELO|nr:hypothetical protein B9Z55_009811 [Caenorhabditis nigoni]